MTTLKGDDRYSLRKEFTGDAHDYAGLMAGQMWVVRFCGEFVAAVSSKEAGLQIVAAHQSEGRAAVTAGDVTVTSPR